MPVNWTWQFGNGEGSNEANPPRKVLYNNPGSQYWVRLEGRFQECFAKDSLPVNVRPLPISSFSVAPGIYCQGSEVTFTSSSTHATLLFWIWEGPNGYKDSLFTTLGTISKSFPIYGEIKVTLRVFNGDTGSSCQSETSRFIQIRRTPSPAMQIPGPLEGCNPMQVNGFQYAPGSFPSNDTEGTLFWNFGNGLPPYTGFQPPATLVFTNPSQGVQNFTIHKSGF
jgi:hypothetical protein